MIYQQSARELVRQLASNTLSIRELLDEMRQRIADVDDRINALPTTCFERAYMEAERLQGVPASVRGPLAGLPVTIKDLVAVKGVRTTFGSRVYSDFIPDVSDRLVQRIEERGGIVYAKSNTPEFGAGGITFNEVFPTTSTPYDLNCSSGGSSGGAAASLASGCAWLSHGSDMAGSLRTPAAFCGVASLRPSPGVISSDSLYLPFDVLGADGPMARDLQDLALFADVLRDWGGFDCQRAVGFPKRPGKVAVSADLNVADVDDEIRENFKSLVDGLAHSGWNIEYIEPDLSDVHNAFDVLRANVFAVALEKIMNENPGVLKHELEWNIAQGVSLTSNMIREAQRAQGMIVNRAAEFMRDYDLLLCPATSVVAVPHEERYVGYSRGVNTSEYYRWLSIAYAVTMTSLPVITLPWMLPSCSKPGGIQVIGKPGSDVSLFSYARELELLLGWDPKPVEF